MKRTLAIAALGCALLFAMSAELSAAAMSAEEILKHWQTAVKADVSASGSSHVTAELNTSGLTGTYEEWSSPDGRYRFKIDLGKGLFIQDVIMLGDSAWQRDKTGKVSRLEGVDLQRMRSSRYFSQSAQFSKQFGGATVEVVPGDSSNNIGLAITPPDGILATYFLDTATWLPHHSTSPADDRISTTWFEDYQELNGQLVSMRSIQRTGSDSRYDVSTRILSIETGITLTDDLFSVEGTATRDFTFASGDRSLSIPIELNGNHIFVPVTINGKAKKWFILDTGAEMGVINKSVAEELNLPMSGELEGRGGGEQSITVALASDLTLEIPGVTISNQTLAAIAFDGLESKFGRHMDGILGSEIFHRFVVQIDYEKKLLHLYDPAKFVYDGTEPAIPIILETNLPMINVTFQVAGCKKVSGKFLLDTGADAAIDISSPKVEADSLTQCASKTYAGNISYGVGGVSKQLAARTDILDFGGHAVPSLIGSLMQDKSGAGASKDRDGLIGGNLFKHFTITFDYTGRRLWLKPNGQFNEIPQLDMSGMKFEAHGEHFDTIVVAVVVPGSVAEQVGMKPGDQLVTVGGKPVNSMMLEDMKEMFRVANPGLKIEYMRDGKRNSATLKLEPVI
ncbi:MAG: aspartyl protease family protein [bacterium]|nr:aspartyl protease family protein [bacterium]